MDRIILIIVSSLQKLLLMIIVFAALYSPMLVALGGSQGGFFLIAMLLLLDIKPLILISRNSASYSIAISHLAIVFGFLLVIILVEVILIVHGTGDFTLPTQLLVAAVAGTVTGFLISIKFRQFSWNFETLLVVLAVVTSVQSLCIILDWWSPSVRAFFETIIIHPEQLKLSLYRASGLSSITGDGLAFLQSIGAALCFAVLTKAHNFWPRIGWTFMFWLQVISIIFLARTGFFLLGVFLLAYMIVYGMKREIVRGLILLMALLGVGLIGSYIVMPELFKAIIQGDQLRYAFEFLFKYLEHSSFETDSSNELLTMFVLPYSEIDLWFGSGYFRYMGMDPGYTRTLSAVGILGSFVIYGWYIYLLFILQNMCQCKLDRALIISFFLILFVSHIKFPFLYLTPVFLFLSLFYFMLRSSYYKNKTLRPFYESRQNG